MSLPGVGAAAEAAEAAPATDGSTILISFAYTNASSAVTK